MMRMVKCNKNPLFLIGCLSRKEEGDFLSMAAAKDDAGMHGFACKVNLNSAPALEDI